jgi:hypothetical protein
VKNEEGKPAPPVGYHIIKTLETHIRAHLAHGECFHCVACSLPWLTGAGAAARGVGAPVTRMEGPGIAVTFFPFFREL